MRDESDRDRSSSKDMTVLITGISGQVGSHLAESYLESGQGVKVHGFIRTRSNLRFLEHAEITDKLHLHTVDITDPYAVNDALQRIKPDIIHHLAAMTFVPASWTNPLDTFEVNVNGTINMLEATRRFAPKSSFHFAGSSEEYGLVLRTDLPIKETTPLRPHSPYGVSKVTGEMLCQQYARTYGLRTILTRAFNHEGPRRGKEFIGPTICRQYIQIEDGKRKIIELGNLQAVRDIMDARDTVDAYRTAIVLAESGEPYNICTGQGWMVKDIAIEAMDAAQMTGVAIEAVGSRRRNTDIDVLIGDNSKFVERTKWCPKYKYKDTLREILEAFRTWRRDEVYAPN